MPVDAGPYTGLLPEQIAESPQNPPFALASPFPNAVVNVC